MGGRQREEGEAGLVQGQACLRIFLLQETWGLHCAFDLDSVGLVARDR